MHGLSPKTIKEIKQTFFLTTTQNLTKNYMAYFVSLEFGYDINYTYLEFPFSHYFEF